MHVQLDIKNAGSISPQFVISCKRSEDEDTQYYGHNKDLLEELFFIFPIFDLDNIEGLFTCA